MKHLFAKITISAAIAGGAFAVAPLLNIADSNVAHAEEQVLRVGSRGAEVVTLQSKLQEKTYYKYQVDGIYGPITKNAVIHFQRDNHLLVDGIAGPQTLGKLYGTTAKAAFKPSVNSSTILRKGSRGQAVRDLQSTLKSLNYYQSAVDGIYGPLTESAVKAFQRANGLTVDGIAGPQTFAALKGNHVKSSESKTQIKHAITTNSSGIVATAKSLTGAPYKWGGTTPSGFDCSGFLNYVFKKQGIHLPRTVKAIWNSGTSVSSPKVGDLVFFETYEPGASHAGIYIGNNQFIHAGTSTGVTISSINNSYWKPRYLGAKSVF